MTTETFMVSLPTHPGVTPQQMKLALTELLYRVGYADEEISVRRMRPGVPYMVGDLVQPGTDIIIHPDAIAA